MYELNIRINFLGSFKKIVVTLIQLMKRKPRMLKRRRNKFYREFRKVLI
jgi:hypothetical protein